MQLVKEPSNACSGSLSLSYAPETLRIKGSCEVVKSPDASMDDHIPTRISLNSMSSQGRISTPCSPQVQRGVAGAQCGVKPPIVFSRAYRLAVRSNPLRRPRGPKPEMRRIERLNRSGLQRSSAKDRQVFHYEQLRLVPAMRCRSAQSTTKELSWPTEPKADSSTRLPSEWQLVAAGNVNEAPIKVCASVARETSRNASFDREGHFVCFKISHCGPSNTEAQRAYISQSIGTHLNPRFHQSFDTLKHRSRTGGSCAP